MKRMLIILSIVFSISCNGSHSKSVNSKIRSNDTLEIELLKLKNQAFCDCYNEALKNTGAKIMPQDGSNYIQISDLVLKYANDIHLRYIIEKWNKKTYSSYSVDNKLYLMRCLDFYNSKDLELYIDSVRKVEFK